MKLYFYAYKDYTPTNLTNTKTDEDFWCKGLSSIDPPTPDCYWLKEGYTFAGTAEVVISRIPYSELVSNAVKSLRTKLETDRKAYLVEKEQTEQALQNLLAIDMSPAPLPTAAPDPTPEIEDIDCIEPLHLNGEWDCVKTGCDLYTLDSAGQPAYVHGDLFFHNIDRTYLFNCVKDAAGEPDWENAFISKGCPHKFSPDGISSIFYQAGRVYLSGSKQNASLSSPLKDFFEEWGVEL